MIKVTYEMVNAITSKGSKFSVGELVDLFNWVQEHSLIDTGRRIIAFMAQTSHETGGFKWLTELGGPSYFTKYDGREDLGNTEPGDGYKFRGRGFIQLTGKANYTDFNKWLRRSYDITIINNPDLVASDPTIAVLAAIWFWEKHDLNYYADKCDIRGLTRKINGGYNGLADRMTRYEILADLMDG